MLVQSKYSDEFSVIGPETKAQKAVGMLRPSLELIPVRRYPDATSALFSPSWAPFSKLIDKINALNPDVVHLHWVTGGMLRIEDLAKIRAPIVWTLHDMWPFTGGCHYDAGCAGYLQQCGKCPVLGSTRSNDLSHRVWSRKKACFGGLPNFTVVALSKWLTDCATSSSLLRSDQVVNLPNPIDTQVFAPFSKAEARRLIGLPQDKKLILFGAMSATSDPRKGFRELAEALAYLPLDYELVVFGSSEPKTPQGFSQKAHYLGQLHDDVSLRLLYCAADVMVVPSLQENLSNAIMESLACGKPVVGFAIGGNPDLIEHKQNGYLAKAYDNRDLAEGINWVLQHGAPDTLAGSARDKVLREFDSRVVAAKYTKLYQRILEGLS